MPSNRSSMPIEFSIPGADGVLRFPVSGGSTTTFCGANGSGKTRLAVHIEQQLGLAAHRISAHRTLSLTRPMPAADRATLPSGEPPLPDGADGQLDRRLRGTSGHLLGGTGGLARKRRLPPALRVPADAHPDRKWYPRLMAPGKFGGRGGVFADSPLRRGTGLPGRHHAGARIGAPRPNQRKSPALKPRADGELGRI